MEQRANPTSFAEGISGMPEKASNVEKSEGE
jgi:hypothetical protein